MDYHIRYVVVNTTIDNEEKAKELAEQMIGKRLAACVQQIQVQSMYHWKGRVESEREFLLLAKTRADLSEKLCAFIKSIHPYEVPEIIVTPVIGGFRQYLEWIAEETE